MNIKEIIQSKTFTGILYGIGVCIAVLAIFELGIVVGFQKARFSYRVNDSYGRLFSDERNTRDRVFVTMRGPLDFDDAHGAAGIIGYIQDNRMLVSDRGGMEKIIIITEQTIIKKGRETVSVNDLREGDIVVVIGAPNDQASIEAKLIRVMPPVPGNGIAPPEPRS